MTAITIPTINDDVIDSRDVIAALSDADLTDTERADLADLAAQGETLADWTYGVTLVADDYFTEYAQQLADDIGCFHITDGPYGLGTSRDLSTEWPFTCIDWEAAATALQADYTALTFDGITFWAR